jgi:hypothetical protein
MTARGADYCDQRPQAPRTGTGAVFISRTRSAVHARARRRRSTTYGPLPPSRLKRRDVGSEAHVTRIQTTHLCDGPHSGVLPILRHAIEYPLGGLSLPALSLFRSLRCPHRCPDLRSQSGERIPLRSRAYQRPLPPHTGAHLRAFLAGGAAASGGGPVGYGVIWPAMAIMRASTDWTSAYPWLETGLRPSLASIDESAML